MAHQSPSATLIVACSRPSPDEAVLAHNVGASAYLPKTCDVDRLVALVRKILGRLNRSAPAQSNP
jgi:DNA-binding response OmpR family regulator